MAPAGVWLGPEPLLLASTSITRRALIERVGIPVETEAPGVDERALEASIAADPPGLAARLADVKALAVSARHPGRVVVGADQVLDLDGESLSKAGDAAEAARQLARLAGRLHRLHAAGALARGGRLVERFGESARLWMRPLDGAGIARYLAVAGAAATRSVGGYEVEGPGLLLFERIEGEHSTILGLPMLPLLAALRRLGFVVA